MLLQFATWSHLTVRGIGQMKKLWRQVRYFEITKPNTYNPIANRLRIFNLRSIFSQSSGWIYFNWIDPNYFSDLHRSRRCAVKKRIKKKHDLLERIEYLENDFFKFTQDTVDVIEFLGNEIKRLERKRKKH